MAGRQPEYINDSQWVEVRFINSYALFMVYLSMAVRGLGFLVFLWTTVVLLGGFVSNLAKKDFWCLTIITLVQTVGGATDISASGNPTNLHRHVEAFEGLVSSTSAISTQYCNSCLSLKRVLVVVHQVNLVVFGVIACLAACPLLTLYLCGLLITTGLSVWRLIQRDYGTVNNDGNLWPALNVIYSLAIVQGVLSYYRINSFFTRIRLVEKVAAEYSFKFRARGSLHSYLDETRSEYGKDLSLIERRRNLVTFAVEQMKSEEYYKFLSGASILDSLLELPELSESGQHGLIKQLVGSASSSHVLKKLLQALDSTRAYDAELREYAATIVAHLADDLSLEQFPGRIDCIASLLVAPRDEDDSFIPVDYKKIMRQGLRILGKLAADENRCLVISGCQDLVSKIMEPLRSDLLHSKDHDASTSKLVYESMEVVRRLMTASGQKTAKELSLQISENKVMTSMERIVNCDICDESLLMQLFEIYRLLPKQYTSWTITTKDFIKKLLDIFTQPYKEGKYNTRALAGEKLAKLSSNDKENGRKYNTRVLAGEKFAKLSSNDKENGRIMLQMKDDVIDGLTTVLSREGEVREDKCRASAAQILEQLCIHYTDNEEYLKKLREALKLTEPYWWRPKIGQACLSLTLTMLRLSKNKDDLARHLKAITDVSFPRKLEELVRWYSGFPMINYLKTWKHITGIFILMIIGHGREYNRDHVVDLLETLTKAAKKMSDVEDAQIISGSSSRSLDSLVKEALVTVLTHPDMDEDIRVFAGKKLANQSSRGKANARVILKAEHDVIGGLSKILVEDKSNRCRISAAAILEQLCIHYTNNDEYLNKLKEALSDNMPKVLMETLKGQTHMISREMQTAVLSLTVTMVRSFRNEEDFACRFNTITRGDASFSLPMKLEQMVKRNIDGITGFGFAKKLDQRIQDKSGATVNCLKILKLTTEIFILMVRHGGNYAKEETDSLMKKLSEAAKNMSDLDSKRTLESLMEVAHQLLRGEKAQVMEAVIDMPGSSSVDGNQNE